MPKKLKAILIGSLVAFAIGFGINLIMVAAGAEPVQSTWIVAGMIGMFVTVGMMNMAGNKPVKLADKDARAAVLALKPSPGKALVVVAREGFMGKALGIDVVLDGRVAAQLKSPRFTAIEVSPGMHGLKAVFAGSMNAKSAPGEASFDLASGQAIVFKITLAMKMTTSDVILTRQDDAAAAVARLARVTMVAAA